MQQNIIFPVLAVVLVLVGLAVVFYFARRNGIRKKLLKKATFEPVFKVVPYDRCYYNSEKPLINQSKKFNAIFKHAAEQCSKTYSQIIFIHGTFVGTDTFGVQPILEDLSSKFSKEIVGKFQKIADAGTTRMAKDSGRFTPEYLELLKNYFSPNTNILEFNWGSENHHAGRYRGLLNLLDFLAALKRGHPNNRVLLVGHSHAGQIFALYTHLLESSGPTKLKSFTYKYLNTTKKNFYKTYSFLQNHDVDFVTLGTPARYKWYEGHYKALHVINHRGARFSGIAYKGIFAAKYGDYVQLWGIEGSDFLPTTKKDRELSSQLNSIIGDQGFNKKVWLAKVSTSNRLHKFGTNLLVDFEDNSLFPISFKTNFFGHGVYMRHKNAAFLVKLITDNLFLP